jgi:hypothetical protein
MHLIEFYSQLSSLKLSLWRPEFNYQIQKMIAKDRFISKKMLQRARYRLHCLSYQLRVRFPTAM